MKWKIRLSQRGAEITLKTQRNEEKSAFRYNVADGSWPELPVSLPYQMSQAAAMYVDICTD